MLSPPQVRGRLRASMNRALKSYNINKQLRDLLRGNNQRVSGSLEGSIIQTPSNFSISVGYDEGIIESVYVSVEIPWGNYGAELDEELGSGNASEAEFEFIKQWIVRKGISTTMTVSAQLKSGSKTYTYNNTDSSRSAMAYFVTNNINSEGEVRTRYDYLDQLRFEIEDVLYDTLQDFLEEYAISFYDDFEVEIDNIF